MMEPTPSNRAPAEPHAPTKLTEEPSVSTGSNAPSGTATWPEPRPLKNALHTVEVFAPGLLPDVLRPWVLDVVERTQAPIEYVAVSAMVALGAALGRKVGVRPKRLDDWQR